MPALRRLRTALPAVATLLALATGLSACATTDTSDNFASGDTPSAKTDASTTSIAITSPDRGVGGTTSATDQRGCPANFYLRTGIATGPAMRTYTTNGTLMDMGPDPAYLDRTLISGSSPSAYGGAEVGYYNAGVPTQHFHWTYWCDAYDPTAKNRIPASVLADMKKKEARSAKSSGEVGDYTAALRNVGTGLYIQDGPDGGGVTLGTAQPSMVLASDDEGLETFAYNTTQTSIFAYSGTVTDLGIQTEGSRPIWGDADYVPANGGAFLQSTALNGGGSGASMFVLKSSVEGFPDPGTSGSGGTCLTSGGSTTVQLAPCDATDTNQWWV